MSELERDGRKDEDASELKGYGNDDSVVKERMRMERAEREAARQDHLLGCKSRNN